MGTALFLSVLARVLILLVCTEFLQNFSIAPCLQLQGSGCTFLKMKVLTKLHKTLHLAVTTTVCGAIHKKLATMEAFSDSNVDAERESVD